MLETLRSWGRRILPADSRTREQRAHISADQSRANRVQTVSDLREGIHRIQHEIAALNDAMTSEPAGASAAQEAKMAALHQELAATQRELGKYQARI
jgi:predicted  nucleic acid-binding Zn-ribbon protein